MKSTTLLTALSVVALSVAAIPGAYAGEAYVTNTDRKTWGESTTDVNVESEAWSNGYRDYESYAEKIYVDGEISIDGFKGHKGWKPSAKNVNFDQFTVHTAEASEFGSEEFGSASNTNVKVWSAESFDEHSHTSAGGIR